MNDLSFFIAVTAAESIHIVGDVDTHSFASNEPPNDAAVILALNSTVVAHYENTASSNCLVFGELSPGGEGISVPFQALVREQFGSLLCPESHVTPFPKINISNNSQQFPVTWPHDETQQTNSFI